MAAEGTCAPSAARGGPAGARLRSGVPRACGVPGGRGGGPGPGFPGSAVPGGRAPQSPPLPHLGNGDDLDPALSWRGCRERNPAAQRAHGGSRRLLLWRLWVCTVAAGASRAGSGAPAGERPAPWGSVGLGRQGLGQAGRAARTQRCRVPAARPGAENERDASLPPAPLGSGFPGPLGETAGAQASVRLRAAPRLGPRQVQPAENPGCLLPEALWAGLQMRREIQVTN